MIYIYIYIIYINRPGYIDKIMRVASKLIRGEWLLIYIYIYIYIMYFVVFMDNRCSISLTVRVYIN